MYKSFEEMDIERVKRHSARLRNINEIRRNQLRVLKANPFQECKQVLEAVIETCLKKKDKEVAKYSSPGKGGAPSRPFPCPAASCPPPICPPPMPPCPCPCPAPISPSRAGAGCAKRGGCGGYTPSGWNKAQAMNEDSSDCLSPKASPCPPKNSGGDCQPPEQGYDAFTSGVIDGNMCPSVRVLGEMAFQLERRILEYVFGAESKNKRRFYGYTVSNTCYMITKESTVPNGKSDTIGKSEKATRFQKIMCALQKHGYNVRCHPEFSQNVVNKFGVLACPPDHCTIEMYRLQDPCALSALISKLSGSPSEVANLNILLRCLSFLSRCDGKPMFVW